MSRDYEITIRVSESGAEAISISPKIWNGISPQHIHALSTWLRQMNVKEDATVQVTRVRKKKREPKPKAAT